MNYQVQSNSQTVELQTESINDLDIIDLGNQEFHILKDGKAFHAKVLETDFQKKALLLEINGSKYQIQIEDEYDALVKKMGLSAVVNKKMASIKAPMPGLVLDIQVEVGQNIEKGTPLLILEAMKMENVLKAEGEGIVKSIEIKKGAAVDKGQLLIEME